MEVDPLAAHQHQLLAARLGEASVALVMAATLGDDFHHA